MSTVWRYVRQLALGENFSRALLEVSQNVMSPYISAYTCVNSEEILVLFVRV